MNVFRLNLLLTIVLNSAFPARCASARASKRGPRRALKFLFVKLLILMVLNIVSVPAFAGTVRTVMLSGEHAPGTELTAAYTTNVQDVCLNGSGRVAFRAKLVGDGISYQVRDWGLWSEGQGALGLIARAGDPCPDMPAGTTFRSFSNMVLNGTGQVSFQPTTNTYTHAIYSATDNPPNLTTGRGYQAPDLPAGLTFNSFRYQTYMAFNDSGQAAFAGEIQGAGTNQFNNQGVWVMGGGSERLVARGGQHPPQAEPGWDLWRFDAPYVNAAGRTAFRANMWNGTAGGKYGIWSDAVGGLDRVAWVGQQAPELAAGVTFSSVPSDMGFNNAGEIVFQGEVTGPGIASLNKEGIWVGAAASELVLAARDGDPAPGAGSGLFQGISYSDPCINGAGKIAFNAQISGANDYGLWAGQSSSLDLVVREGWQAPGLTPGVQFEYITDPSLNGAGALAFTASLRGSGVTTANDNSLWATSNDQLVLVAREGDHVEVGPSVFKTISGIQYFDRVGTESGRPSSFNDMGQLAYVLSFTDNTAGVFVTTVTDGGSGSVTNPVMPDNADPGLQGEWVFDGVSGAGQWFDPPMANGYRYETDGFSSFTQAILPGGIGDADGLFTITDSVNGEATIPAGSLYVFPVPVDQFTVMGIDPTVDGGDPSAFPTFLVFDQTTVNFIQTPVPELSTITMTLFGVFCLAVFGCRPQR